MHNFFFFSRFKCVFINHFVVDKLFNRLKAFKIEKCYLKKVGWISHMAFRVCSFFSNFTLYG